MREVLVPKVPAKAAEPDGVVSAIVYYLTFDGGRTVKIGTTTNPRGRFAAHAQREGAPGELLAAEPGHFKLERQLHRKFAHLRVAKFQRREFYELNDKLRAHIEEVKTRNPDWRDLPGLLHERREAA